MSESGFYFWSTNKLYKKEKTKRIKIFPAGYVESFYRNRADNIDNFTGSDFYSRIAADADIPKEDVQKYLLATSDFAKSIQTDINHYVIRDRINDASLRQKLDPISKNILIRQNLLELVFEDISTFDAENPMVRSLLREIDLNKKQTDSNFIKSPPIHPGKEFEIKKRLDRLRGIKRVDDENNNNNNSNNNNNNNGNDGGGGGDLFGPPRSTIPTVPNINNLLNPPPEEYDIQQRLNRLVLEGEDLLQEKFNALKNPAPRAHPNEIPFLANTYVPAPPFPFR